MLAVSNTSPISNLAIVGRLEFLHRRYATVRIPPAVAEELRALTHPAGLKAIQAALSQKWLVIEPLAAPPSQTVPHGLDHPFAFLSRVC